MPEPCTPSSGLGMNVACRPWDGGDLAHDQPERHHAVGHRQRVGVAQVDLLLARRVLVEAVLDRDAHRLERADRLLAQRPGDVVRREVEEAALVERLRAAGRARAARSRRTRCPGRRRTSGPGRAAARTWRRSTWRGSPSNGVPSRLWMSQNTRASGTFGSPHGSTSNVSGSGIARTSDSWIREKPSIDEPSNVIPSSSAFSSSAGLMAKLFRLPRMSVNQRRIRRTPRSSTLRRTYSRCWSSISFTPPVWSMDRTGRARAPTGEGTGRRLPGATSAWRSRSCRRSAG